MKNKIVVMMVVAACMAVLPRDAASREGYFSRGTGRDNAPGAASKMAPEDLDMLRVPVSDCPGACPRRREPTLKDLDLPQVSKAVKSEFLETLFRVRPHYELSENIGHPGVRPFKLRATEDMFKHGEPVSILEEVFNYYYGGLELGRYLVRKGAVHPEECMPSADPCTLGFFLDLKVGPGVGDDGAHAILGGLINQKFQQINCDLPPKEEGICLVSSFADREHLFDNSSGRTVELFTYLAPDIKRLFGGHDTIEIVFKSGQRAKLKIVDQ